MIQFLKALVILPIAVAVILLAVANRAPVTVSLDPFSRGAPEFSFALPLFALVFAAVMLGVLIGGAAAWLAQRRYRRGERRYRREATRLRSETDRLRNQAGVPPGLAALPSPGSPRL